MALATFSKASLKKRILRPQLLVKLSEPYMLCSYMLQVQIYLDNCSCYFLNFSSESGDLFVAAPQWAPISIWL